MVGVSAGMAHETLHTLRERVRRIERPSVAAHGVVPLGVTAIDRVLPGGGLARGALHEILGAGGDEEDGALAAAFAAGLVARLVATAAAPVLWCLARPDLYGPGLVAHGLDPARLLLAQTARDADLLWAMEEGLRSPGLAAVVGEIAILPDVAGRRLQLAAERSGVTAFVLRRWYGGDQAARERRRPPAAPRQPSPAGGEGNGSGSATKRMGKGGGRGAGPRTSALADRVVALPGRQAGGVGGRHSRRKNQRCDASSTSGSSIGRSTGCGAWRRSRPAATAPPQRLRPRPLPRLPTPPGSGSSLPSIALRRPPGSLPACRWPMRCRLCRPCPPPWPSRTRTPRHCTGWRNGAAVTARGPPPTVATA